MKQYQQKTQNVRKHRPIVESKSGSAGAADTALLADRLRWTEQLVEQQRRELRRLEGVVEQLRGVLENKLRR
jgi:hypothetical protein